MRPLRLDIAGFAAFRDPITVDFTDAEYFALTGPTGSGKSTVIDALTFALYGSAPRWGRDNAIQYALAPTANRCAVRLVFDVADQRYVVAREVRRSGKQISQKNPRLERFLDPAATGDPEADEPVESMAADTRGVRQQVAELLGLDFDDFCTCVVLPQGDFATFLQASVAERQTILLKLLGARHYETIGRMAGRRATEASARIDALQGQLVGYADATEEAENVAREREASLAALAEDTAAQVSELTEVLAGRTEITGRVDRLAGEIGLLAAIEAPAGIDDLQRILTTADTAYATADRAERQAGEALLIAEEALRTGPQRGPLEETLRWHTEWARESARTLEVTRADEEAVAALAVAAQAATVADHDLDQARTDHEGCRVRREESAAGVSAVERQLALVAAVVLPAGTADLDRGADAAQKTLTQATKSLEAAETTVIATTEAVAALPERSAITALQRTVDGFDTTLAQLDQLQRRIQTTTDELAAADDAAVCALVEREQALEAVDQLRTRSVAADLRPHLAVGDACPVCDQVVATLPAALEAPALDAAREILSEADEHLRAAGETRATLQTRLTGVRAQSDTLVTRLTELDRMLASDLPDLPAGSDRNPVRDRAEVEALLASLDQTQAAQRAALRVRETARQALRTAEQDRDRIAEEARHSWAMLHATHGQLSALGAPPATAAGLAEAWAALVRWSTAEADRLTTHDLTEARSALQDADIALHAAVERLQMATAAARTASEAHTSAAVAESKAAHDRAELARRLADLEGLLAGRPAEAETRRLLAEHQLLDRAAADARADAQAAARARQEAEAERDRRRAEREASRSMLHRVREPLVALGVPAVDDTDLSTVWAALVGWAAGQAEARRCTLAGLQADLTHCDVGIGDRLAALAELLEARELPTTLPTLDELVGPGGSTRMLRIPTDVELATERARAATAEIGRRRGEAERLRTTIASDTEIEQVARDLALMMSARRFPQWLANEALDTLVQDASLSLLRLSGGQFELTHEKGEFFVIDHTDADSLRSVKTLSGGETFQASLALALALSEQLSTLAAGGRATLDSIFLDEGFGTLDPDALEIVASTLENLAQGRRMVGVVTHVAALAERVPVRFEVSRDSRTSTIERVGP